MNTRIRLDCVWKKMGRRRTLSVDVYAAVKIHGLRTILTYISKMAAWFYAKFDDAHAPRVQNREQKRLRVLFNARHAITRSFLEAQTATMLAPKKYRAPATSAIYYVSSTYARGTISSAYYSVESCTDYITLSSRRNSVWQSEWCTVLLQQAPPGCTTQAVFGAYCSDFYGFTLWYLTHV